jgi:hypothetical protein
MPQHKRNGSYHRQVNKLCLSRSKFNMPVRLRGILLPPYKAILLRVGYSMLRLPVRSLTSQFSSLCRTRGSRLSAMGRTQTLQVFLNQDAANPRRGATHRRRRAGSGIPLSQDHKKLPVLESLSIVACRLGSFVHTMINNYTPESKLRCRARQLRNAKGLHSDDCKAIDGRYGVSDACSRTVLLYWKNTTASLGQEGEPVNPKVIESTTSMSFCVVLSSPAGNLVIFKFIYDDL